MQQSQVCSVVTTRLWGCQTDAHTLFVAGVGWPLRCLGVAGFRFFGLRRRGGDFQPSDVCGLVVPCRGGTVVVVRELCPHMRVRARRWVVTCLPEQASGQLLALWPLPPSSLRPLQSEHVAFAKGSVALLGGGACSTLVAN